MDYEALSKELEALCKRYPGLKGAGLIKFTRTPMQGHFAWQVEIAGGALAPVTSDQA